MTRPGKLSALQLWLLTIALPPDKGFKIFEGFCVPGRFNGRGLRTVLMSLEKRGLVKVARAAYCTMFSRTDKGHKFAMQWGTECRRRGTTAFDEAHKERRQ